MPRNNFGAVIHGTRNGYNYGCRCTQCANANGRAKYHRSEDESDFIIASVTEDGAARMLNYELVRCLQIATKRKYHEARRILLAEQALRWQESREKKVEIVQ